MPIETDKNERYGPPLVTQKYAPLLDITFDSKLDTFYSALLTNRYNLLRYTGLLAKPLQLATPGWAGVIAAEAGKSPPLVVISSNRSAWIKSGLAAADAQLAIRGLQTFDNVSDLRALSADSGQKVSPPIYCPKRIGPNPNRNVYIVVHISEYAVYKKALLGTGITAVGWEFKRVNGIWLTGFGASRFAAIEFCKVLRSAAIVGGRAPWDYAWLIDDNVVALSSFAGFAAVELAMKAGDVCAGFQGGTKAEAFLTNRDWARKEITDGRGGQAAKLPPSKPPGIVQQAALWNIAYLSANYLNFGPVFITSGEDLSITNYFNAKTIPYFFYDGITVRKEETKTDAGRGGQNLNTAKQQLTAWVIQAESAKPPGGNPPPPIEVKPKSKEDGDVQSLGEFIGRVLDKTGLAGNLAVQNTAKSQAVEQITCGAINGKHVKDPALASTFKINGTTDQAVDRHDI